MFRNFLVKILCFTHLFFNTFFSFCRTSELTLAPYFIEDIPCKRSYFEDFSCPLLLQPDPIASPQFSFEHFLTLDPMQCQIHSQHLPNSFPLNFCPTPDDLDNGPSTFRSDGEGGGGEGGRTASTHRNKEGRL